MLPSPHLLREKPLSTLFPRGNSGLCSEILYLFSSFAACKSWGPPFVAPQAPSTSTHCAEAHPLPRRARGSLHSLTLVPVPDSVLGTPRPGASASLRSHLPFPLPAQVPEAPAALLLVPAAALLSFNVCQRGRVPARWCLIPWEPPGAGSGAPGLSQRMALAPWGVPASDFPAGFCFPPSPLGGSPESASACPHHGLGARVPVLRHPQRRCYPLGGQPAPSPGRGGLVLGLCLRVSSLTPLSPLSVPLFCLNGADSLLLGGLLSSSPAFGFGVYCFSFPHPA